MSTAILPDGSVVVKLAWQTVHLDVRTRAIHLRTPSAEHALGGDILESFPQVAVDRVRVLRGKEQAHHLLIELRSGRALSLGHASSHDLAMMTARVVADLTRCKVEVSDGAAHDLPGPSQKFSQGPTMETHLRALEEEIFEEHEPTKKMTWEEMASEPPPSATARTIEKSAPIEAATSIIIDDEDPLDDTACRPASTGERMIRVDSGDLEVPAPRRIKAAEDAA